jgi:mono/diheme cytochrome c family protein
MRQFLFCCAGLAWLAVAPSVGWAQGDIERGRVLAEQICSRCHDIGPGGQMKQDPPTFAAIAQYRTEGQIIDKIVAPHVRMPRMLFQWDWMLLEGNVDDMVAYILSLEKTGQ